MRTSPLRRQTDTVDVDKARVAKHIFGHPRSYRSFSSETIRNRASTMPVDVGLERTSTGPGIDKTNSAPPALSPTTPTLPPSSVDLEQGQEVEQKPSHWWQRKPRGNATRRVYPANTREAHAKTPTLLLREILLSSWANLLLVFVPVGIALHFVNVSPTVVFVMNFLAIVPLAGVRFPLFSPCSPPVLRQFCYLRTMC